MSKYKNSLFIFTRDLRLDDNKTLIEAGKQSEFVIPIFIFNEDQITKKNKFKSNNSIQFMCETIKELNDNIKKYNGELLLFEGNLKKILIEIIKKIDIDAIFISLDYTPFSKEREKTIEKICNLSKIEFNVIQNHKLINDNVLNQSGTHYKKFTPFYNSAKKYKVDKPLKYKVNNFKKISIKLKYKINITSIKKYYIENNNINVRGGNTNMLKIVKNLKKFKNYNKDRDFLDMNTTHLSAYLKFGLISIRNIYYIIKKYLGDKNLLIKQLYWRDFYTNILEHNPEVLETSMNKKYRNIKWTNDKNLLNAWKKGETGFPIVDAGMRQLITTGYMHNRCRMIVANFLIKILHCNWQLGEHFFAINLVDYDPALNNGNWQWCASTGADSQPYFRIFNPWRQMEKYDKECKYIKRWIPELENVNNKDILKWDTQYNKYDINYPKPIIKDYQTRINKTLKMYS